MFHLPPKLYQEVVSHLIEAIDCDNYFSGSLTFEHNGVECRLICSVIVYRHTEATVKGGQKSISDLIPVWWEFHTVGAEGRVENDFCFSELKLHL